MASIKRRSNASGQLKRSKLIEAMMNYGLRPWSFDEGK